MKLKLDANGNVVVVDGKPVYVHDDNKEIPFDAAAAMSKISGLNAESKTHRERAETAEGKLKAFEGIDDPAAASKALQIVANLDQKKLIDAGEVDKVKGEITKVFQTQLEEINARNKTLESQLYDEKIGGNFARSKVIADKLAIPADMVQARFGSNFKIEDGKVVAVDSSGNKIYSRTKPGELAEFDEALDTLIDQYAHKDTILKGTGSSGGGTMPGQGGGSGGSRQIKRSDFEAMPPQDRAVLAKEKGVTIVD